QAAVAAVNASPSEPATIRLGLGTYDLTSQLVISTASELTIQGDPSGGVVVENPSHSDRIFEIDGGNVTINGLAINGGSAPGGIGAEVSTLIVDHGTVSRNTAGVGGGIFIAYDATLIVDYGTITGNSATLDGGGVHAESTTVSVEHSTVSANTTQYTNGGGIY